MAALWIPAFAGMTGEAGRFGNPRCGGRHHSSHFERFHKYSEKCSPVSSCFEEAVRGQARCSWRIRRRGNPVWLPPCDLCIKFFLRIPEWSLQALWLPSYRA